MKSKLINKSVKQIIKDLDIVKKAIEYHYDIETEALNTDDVYNGELLDFIADELAEYDNDAMAWYEYERIAGKIMDKIADDIADKIIDYDHDAIETYDEIEDDRKGDY